MCINRIKGYPNGTAATVGSVTLMKWSKNWWSAWDGQNRTWGETALRAMRGLPN